MKDKLFANIFFSACVLASFFLGDADYREKLLIYAPPLLVIVWLEWLWAPNLKVIWLWIAKLLKRD